MDSDSQQFFDSARRQYFPPERNFLNAHLTLFHQLPNHVATQSYIENFIYQSFEMRVNGLMHLGAGVAYKIESESLQFLHRELSNHFKHDLIPQDRQPYKPHVVIQNKVTPAASKKLLSELKCDFEPFTIKAVGFDLWIYLGGPWRHSFSCDFKNESR